MTCTSWQPVSPPATPIPRLPPAAIVPKVQYCFAVDLMRVELLAMLFSVGVGWIRWTEWLGLDRPGLDTCVRCVTREYDVPKHVLFMCMPISLLRCPPLRSRKLSCSQSSAAAPLYQPVAANLCTLHWACIGFFVHYRPVSIVRAHESSPKVPDSSAHAHPLLRPSMVKASGRSPILPGNRRRVTCPDRSLN